LLLTLDALDLFAGAGGLSLGLEAAGFSVVGAIEVDADACATYRANHPRAAVLEGDIAGIDFRAWRGIALIAGGPPCQPFSVGGKRLAAGDARNGIPEFVRAVSEASPEAFLLENVAGLTAGAKRAYLLEVLDQFEALGYVVAWQVLQAADYGLPQLRRRLFVVGTKGRRTAVRFRFPAPAHAREWASAGTVLDPRRPAGEPNNAIITYARHPSLRPGPYHGHLYNGGGRPIELARPAPTLLASMGGNKTPWVDTLGIVPHYHAHLLAGGAPREGLVPGARRITVEEAARLQGFRPGTFFSGGRSSRYRQVGNAVPPPLAESLGQAVKEHLARRPRYAARLGGQARRPG